MKAMTLSLVTFFVGLGAWAQAIPETRFVCATVPLTTTYALLETAGHYELRILHHNGLQFAPLHRGTVTTHDLDVLMKKSEILKEIGERASIPFLKSECRFQETSLNCFMRRDVKVGSLTLKNPSFRVSPRRIVTDLVDYPTHDVELFFRLGSEGVSFPMEYSPRDCVFKQVP